MREFYVYLVFIGGIKTAIITEKERVIGVVGNEDMSNTDLIRAYSHLILQRSQEGIIYTNHRQVRFRKRHTSDFRFNYVYRGFNESKKNQIIELGYKFIDEQDQKLAESRRENG